LLFGHQVGLQGLLFVVEESRFLARRPPYEMGDGVGAVTPPQLGDTDCPTQVVVAASSLAGGIGIGVVHAEAIGKGAPRLD
jgi:hypothetical protein